MTKQIYEEALADVRKVTEVAEDRAKKAILEAVTPRIRDLIDREVLREDAALLDDEMGFPTAGPADAAVAGAMSLPDEEGKVTLDLDAMADPCGQPVAVGQPMFGKQQPEVEYELSLESLGSLDALVGGPSWRDQEQLQVDLLRMVERVDEFKKAGRLIRETRAYGEEITQMISRVEDMYDYVQEAVTDPANKGHLESLLESNYRDLTALQEQTKMSKKKLIDLLREEDEAQVGGDLDLGGDEEMGAAGGQELTLKLTGLPDDVDLDSVGVDLISGDEGPEMGDLAGDEEMGGELGGEEGMDLGGLEGDLGGEEEEGTQMEVSRLSDDTIVEIDENMLRREIRRMRGLSEASDEKPGDANGHGVDADVLDDFGGGKEEGEAFLDGEVTTGGAEPLGEADEMGDADGASMIEMDEMDELQNRRGADEAGEPATTHRESLQRRLAFESRLRGRARRRAAALKEGLSKAKGQRRSALREEYNKTARRFNESLARTKKFKGQLVELASHESRPNGGSKQLAETAAEKKLRVKLAAENLHNVKLTYANKVLQNESLTKRQKAQVIGKLDEAKTPREAKLVYETVAGNRKPLQEGQGRRPMGSSSRATRPGSTQTLNEGFETERWSKLAGITK